MPTVATHQSAKLQAFSFEEGQALVYQHMPTKEQPNAAIGNIRKIMKAKHAGDVVESLNEFRHNSRG